MSSIVEPPNTAPLWARARASFARAVSALGAPAAIAAIAFLSKSLRRDIVRWLCPLECVARRLLLADAVALHRARARPANCAPRVEIIQLRSLGLANHAMPREGSAALRAACVAGAGRSNHDASQPAAWPARFSFALPRDTRVSNARAPRILSLWDDYTPPPEPARTPRVLKSQAFRLARRFEALRRVLENPRLYAERLARLIVREARRVPQLVQRYVWSGSRVDGRDPADPRLSLEALGVAFDAPEAFKDTS